MGDHPAEELAGLIAAALKPSFGEVKVAGLASLTSGASRRSWRFSATHGDGSQHGYVLQETVPLASVPEGEGPLPMATQAAVIEAAHAGGVPVAPVVASGSWGPQEYIISGWLDGEALPPRLLRDPALEQGCQRLQHDAARGLAAIHRIPTDGLDLRAEDRLATYRERLHLIGEPRPALEMGLRWLEANRPPPRPPVVVHGDFRLGNLLVGKDGLQAVLDWELVHLGDPHEDVAWATIRAWRFDRYRRPGVFPEPDMWVTAYNEAAGPDAAVDPEAVRWWQVAGTWFWAVICVMQARRHLDGHMQSLEHAVIGRRVCESEWDLLQLLPGPVGSDRS